MRLLLSLAGLILGGVGATAQSPVPIRVMSFNIRYGTAPDGVNHWDRRKDFLVETIQTFDPDLLGTQETLASQRDFLSQKLTGYTAVGVGRDDGRDQGEMAALFYRTSRFEKLDTGHFWLSDKPDTIGSKGWDAALPRVASWVKLKDRNGPDAKPIVFLNTHLDHRGAKARAESAKLIRTRLKTLGAGCRLIVTGDFNAAEGTEPYKALFEPQDSEPSSVQDTYRSLIPIRSPNEGTFSGFQAEATTGGRIDWIGASRDWDLRSVSIDRTARDGRTPSDHFPVTAVVRAHVEGTPTRIRVLSYNIHHGEGTDGKVDLPRLARVIRQADADLVALQEVDQKTKRTGMVEQTAELARLTGMFGLFGKAIDYQGGEYGQSILSRVPFDGPGLVHTLPGEPDREQRIAYAIPVTLDGQPLQFVTTHLHHQNDDFRQRQATKLNELFATEKRPIVLAGDLNANPDSKPLAILAEKWVVATTGPGLESFPAGTPTKQIDYILTRPAGVLHATGARVIPEAIASDHRPILVELTRVPIDRPKVIPPYTKPTNIAHRGSSGTAPEHTLAAYSLALKHGADYVEPDLQMTKDGVLVCLHDTTLERTTNVEEVFPDRATMTNGRKTWPVADFTLAEIQKLDAGSWKDAKYAAERVPTFQEMIDLVKGKAGLIPETKAPEVYGRRGLNMEAALMAILKKNQLDRPGADPKTPVVIQSFSEASLKSLRANHQCRLPLVYLYSEGESTPDRLKTIQAFADGIAPHKSVVLARPALVKDAHELGLSVTVWTFRRGQTGRFNTVTDEMNHFLHDLHVDAVFTDNPDLFPKRP